MAMARIKDQAAVALGRKGGKARLKTMSPEERSERASIAGQASALVRWGGKKKKKA